MYRQTDFTAAFVKPDKIPAFHNQQSHSTSPCIQHAVLALSMSSANLNRMETLEIFFDYV
jgi:hypothetical protein